MTWLRSEEEVDALIEEMKSRGKGKYITQGVAFNKTCPRQMDLLKSALMSSISFSGLGKELLAVKFSDNANTQQNPHSSPAFPVIKSKPINLGNFI